jgi:hypothetical protein
VGHFNANGARETGMDGLEFTEKVVGHIVVLLTAYAWPIVGALIVLSQKAALQKLIEGISELSLKIGNSEAKIGTRKIEGLTKTVDVAEAIVTETVPDVLPELPPSAPPQKRVKDKPEEAPQEGPGVLIEPTNGENLVLQARKRLKFRDSARSSTPSVVIERAWQEVRNSVYKLLGIDKTATDWFDLDGWPDDQLIAKLKSDPRVDTSLMKAVVELKMIRNDATTRVGWQPTTNDARSYQENAQRVVGLVEIAGAQKKTAQ